MPRCQICFNEQAQFGVKTAFRFVYVGPNCARKAAELYKNKYTER